MCAHWDNKTQRRDQFIQALYAFHKGHWYSITSIIWNQIHKFWDWVHARRAATTKSWGLPFPFMLTHILKKKGIKETPEDGLITEHPFFVRNQWNHSQLHMPRGVKAQIPTVERVKDAKHMEENAPAPQQGGRGGFVVISNTEYEFLCGANQCMDKLEQRFDNMEKWFDAQDNVLKAILERLPPAAGASSSVPPREHQ
jgi:hypothetical protein